MNVNLSTQEYGNLYAQEPTFQGREGNLYRVKKNLYKLYHNPYLYSAHRLQEIISYQKWLQYTTLPIGPIYVLDQFIGAILKEHIDSKPFSSLKTCSREFQIEKLKELIRNLEELHEVGLTLHDFDIYNVLILKTGQIELIDLDGDNICLLHEKQELTKLLKQVRSTILECCFGSFDSESALPYLTDDELSYPVLKELLERIQLETLDQNKCLLYNEDGEQYGAISISKHYL